MKKEKHILRIIGFLIGLGIFAYTIHKIGGVRLVLNNLIQLKYAFLFIIANSFVYVFFYTSAWQLMFRGLKSKIGYFSLLRIRMCSEGVNFMTPFGFMAGDPVRLFFLKKYFGPEARLRSVVVDRCLYSMAAQYFNVLGILLIFTQTIDFPLWLHFVILTVYLTICFVLTTLVFRMATGKGFGVFDKLFKLIKIEKRFPRVNEILCELRDNLNYYKNRRKHSFFLAFFYHFIGRILMAGEIMIAFYAFTGQIDFLFSVIVASLTSFFAVSFAFIPGAIGVLETMYAQLFTLYGYPPDMGVTIQIIRRIRVLFWIGMGLLLLDYDAVGNYTKRIRKSKFLGRKTKDLTK